MKMGVVAGRPWMCVLVELTTVSIILVEGCVGIQFDVMTMAVLEAVLWLLWLLLVSEDVLS